MPQAQLKLGLVWRMGELMLKLRDLPGSERAGRPDNGSDYHRLPPAVKMDLGEVGAVIAFQLLPQNLR